jgi:hypothetical protein
MTLPTDIFIHTNDREEPLQLTGATWMRGKWRRPAGTYRDGEDLTPGVVLHKAAGTISTDEQASEIPAFGQDGVAVDPAFEPTKLQYVAPDHITHIPPRQRWEIAAGYIVAVEGASLPSVYRRTDSNDTMGRDLLFTPIAVTVNTALNRLSVTGANIFRAGDRVLIQGDVLPAPASADVIYEVLLSTSFVFIKNPATGLTLDFTTAGTNVTLTLLEPSPRRVPTRLALTVDHTAERFTSTDPDYFITGDIIRLTAGTVPAGSAVNTRYRVRGEGSANFQLENEATGALLTITSDGAAVFGIMVEPADLTRDTEVLNLDGYPGLLTFEDDLSPKISNVA